MLHYKWVRCPSPEYDELKRDGWIPVDIFEGMALMHKWSKV